MNLIARVLDTIPTTFKLILAVLATVAAITTWHVSGELTRPCIGWALLAIGFFIRWGYDLATEEVEDDYED